VTAIEEPRERIGLGKTLQRLTLFLHHEHLPDVAGEELERLEIRVVERFAVVSIGHAQDAARVVADEDGHAHERIGAVRAFTGLDRRARHVTHEERALRLRDETHDALSGLDPHAPHDVVRESDRAGDHEIGGVVLP